MFRQRLKGGHKVGATQQQVPPPQTQGGAASSFSSNSGIANVGWGFGDDWNWDTAEQSNSWAGAGPQQPSGQYGPKQQHPVQQHPVQQHPVQEHPVQQHLAEQQHPMLQHNLPLQQYAAQQALNPILSQPNDPRIGRSSSQPTPNVQPGLCNQQPNQHSQQHPQQQNLYHPPQQQNNVRQGLYQPQHDAQPCYLKVNPLQGQGTGNANNANHTPRPQQQGNPNLINNNNHNNNNNIVGWSDNWDDWGLQDNVQQQRQQQQFDHEKQTQQWHQQQHQYEVQPPPPAPVEANSKPQQDCDEWGDVWEDMTEDEQQEHLEQQRQLQQQEQQQQKIQQQLQQMQQQQHIQHQVDRQIHSEKTSVPAGHYCPFVSEASNVRKISNGVPDILTQATTQDGTASFTGFNIAEDPVDSTAVESEPKESYSHHYQYSTEETVQLATIGDHEPARPASSEQMVQQNYVASTANNAATGENVAPSVSPVVDADAKPYSTDEISSTDGGDGWGDQVGWEASPAEPTYHHHHQQQQHHLEGGDQEWIGEHDFNSSQNQQQHHHTQEGSLHNQGYFNSDNQHQDHQPISHEICDGEKDGDLIMKASGEESNQQPPLQLDYHSKLNSERGQNYTSDQYQFHQQQDQNAGHFQHDMFDSEEPSEPIDSASNMETATKDKAVVAPVSGDQSPGDGDGLANMRVTAPPQPSASPAAAPVDEGALDSWDKWNEGNAIEGGPSHEDQATAVSSILLGVTHKDQATAVASISTLPSTATNNEQVSGSVNGVADVNMQASATTASTSSSSNTSAQSRSSPEQDATTAAVAPSGTLAADQMPLGSFLDIELAEHCSQTSVGSSDGLHERLGAIEDQQRFFTHAGSSETHRQEETQPSLLHSASGSQQQAHAPWQGMEGDGSTHEQPQQPQLQAEPVQDWQQGWSNDDGWGYSHVGEEHVDSYDGLRSDPQIYRHYDHPALPEHPHVQQESVQHQMDEMELHLHPRSSGLIHEHGLENQMQQLPGTSINQSQPNPIDIEFSHLQSQSSSVHGEVMSVGHQQAFSDVSLDHPARPLSSHSNLSAHSHHSSTSNLPNIRGMAASAASHPPSVGSSRPPSVHTPQSDSQAASSYRPAPPTSSSEYKIVFQSQQPGISGPLVDFSEFQTQRVSPETAVTLLDSFPSETPLVSNEVSAETHQPALVSSHPFSSAPSAELVSTDAAVGSKFDDVTVVSSVPPLSPTPPPPMSAPLPPMSAAPTPMSVPPPPMSAPLMSSAAPPPPMIRPSGSVQNFRARKGSPFQPPSLNKVPSSTAFHPSLPLDAVSHSIEEGLDIGNSLDSNALLQATNVTLPNASVRLSVATSEEPIMEPSVHATRASNDGFGTFTVNAVPLVVPSMISNPQMIPTASSSSTVTSDKRSLALGDLEPSYGDGMTEEEQQQLQQQASAPPIAHHLNLTAKPQTPKVRSLASMPSTPNTPTVLNLSVQYSGNQHHASNLLVSNSHDLRPEVVTERSAEDNLRRTDDESDDDNADGEEEDDDSGGVPRFSRMVPGCGSSTADPQPVQPTQPSAAPPPMPTDRVVTGIDNPIAPPSQQMPPPSGVAGGNMSVSGGQSMPPPPPPQQQRTAMHPPKRSATIGSEESGTTSTTQLLQQQQTKPSAASVSSSSPLPSSKQRPLSTSTSSISPPQSPVFDPSYDQASRSRVTTTHHQQKKGRFADRRRNDDYYYGDKGGRYPESRSSRHRHEQGYRDEMARYGDGEGARDYKSSANASSRPYDDRNANSRRHDSNRYYDEDGYYQRSGEGSRSSSLDGGDSYPPSYRSRPHGSGSRTHDGPSRDHSGAHALGEGRSNDPSESRGRNKHMDRRDNSYERRGVDSSSVDHHHRRDKIRDRDGAAGAGDSGDRSDRGDRSSRRDRRDWRDQQAPPAVPPPPRDRDWDRELDSDWERDHPTSRDWERDHPTSRDWERERDREYRRDYIRDYYGRGYPGYGDPYGGKSARDAYDPQHYYYYYYSRYYDQNPKYRDYYNSMLKHYHQQYPLSQPPTSLPDERASVRSGRSSVNDDVKKSALNTSRTSAAPQPLYDPYGLYHHQLQQQQQHHLETSSQFLGEFHERSSLGGYEPSSIYQPIQDSLYRASSGDVSGRGSVDHVSRLAAQRLTPTLFTRPHTIAQFTATGQIILLLPSDRSSSYNRRGSQDALDDADDAAGTIRIMDVKDVLANNEDVRQELTIIEAFPGPLTRHDTHKDVVVRFCESKHKSLLESCNAASSLDPRQEQLLASQLLLWQYLGLLVRQNGKLCPADLAGLLVDSARERRKNRVKKLEVAASAEELNSQMDRLALEGQPQQQDPDQEQRDDDCASEPSHHHHLNSRQDRAGGGGFRGSSLSLSSSTNRLSSMLLPGQQMPATSNLHLTALRCLPQLNADELEEVNSRMSELVCLGRRREAIEVAVEHRLWGHAMAIGSRMEQAVGGRVLSAFLQTVASDDVMHTLVQQVNGKRPEVTKSYSVTRWGDWRRHLATLVANPSPQLGKDQAAMMALGDTLAGAGDIAAGHLCYLIGGGVSAWGQKLHLLGCGQSTEQILATPTCRDALYNIQCSEVYEYGLSLATADLNSTSMTASTLASGAEHRLPGFQQHKLRYAATLAQYGYVQEAVRYCEVIAASISECPDQHPVDLTARLHHLASCLKYHHTHYQLGEGEPQDMPDPQWLASLQMVLYEQQQQMLLRQQQLQESVVEGSNQVMAAAQDDHQKIQQSVANAESAYQTDYNGGVSSAVVLDAKSGGEGIKSDYAGEVPPMSADRSDGPSRASFHPQEDGGYDLSEHKPQPAPMSGQYVNGTNAASEHSQQPSGLKQEVPDQLEDGSCNNNGDGGQQQYSFQPMLMPTGHESLGGESAGNSPRGYPPSMGYSASTDSYKRGSLGEVGDGGSSLGGSQQPTPHFTPTHHPQQHQYGLPPSGAASTLPPSPSHRPTLQQGDNQHQQKQPNNNSSDVDGGSGKPGNKSGGGSDSGRGGEGGTDKGFLSRIFGWKNNQAKLPDDKNPTIVWDEERKRWVNTDGTDDTDTPPPPPPTAAALPLNSTISRAGPRRSRYVNPVDEKDRVKPSTTITPPLPMPSMMPASMHPPMPQKQMQQQIPQQQMLHQMPQQQQMMQPQQQPPNSFGDQQQPMPNAAVQEQPSEVPIEVVPDAGLRTAVGSRTRSDSSSIDLDDAGASQDQDESNAGSGQPMFFNPAQFQQTQQQQQASRGRGGRGGPANNIRRGRGGGPQRRSFQGGGAAPPPLPRA